MHSGMASWPCHVMPLNRGGARLHGDTPRRPHPGTPPMPPPVAMATTNVLAQLAPNKPPPLHAMLPVPMQALRLVRRHSRYRNRCLHPAVLTAAWSSISLRGVRN